MLFIVRVSSYPGIQRRPREGWFTSSETSSAGRFPKLQRSAMAMARVAKEKGSARSKDGEEPVAMAMAGVCSLNSFGLDL